jgi:alkaline phosphatase D
MSRTAAPRTSSSRTSSSRTSSSRTSSSRTWTRRSFMQAAAAAGAGGLLLPYGVGLTRDQALAQTLPLGVTFDPDPFPLGVASGDPTADSVILQTRLSDSPFDLDRPWGSIPDDVEVGWVVATDPQLRRVVASGTVGSSAATGHSVHVDVTGLDPGATYFYAFSALGRRSRTGRTRTAGIAPLQRLRVAYVSCQSFPHGYFTAYQNLCREDVDVVLHLGDYMYEYGTGGYGDLRQSPPDAEVFSINSYRVRYAAYRGDVWLRQAHAMFPFVTVWDDHEVDNNWAGDAPENTTDEGNQTPEAFAQRRFNAYQAYYENMPIRPAPEDNDPADPTYRIHRQLIFGDLLDISMLDTRQYRTDQPCDDGFIAVNCAEQQDPDATIMGAEQRDWLFTNLSTSTTAWRMIAQQLIVSQVRTTGPPLMGSPELNVYLSADQWDGYLVERQALMSHLAEEQIPDTFIITGDIHSHWVLDLKEDFDDATSAVLGAEFVGTSVTSPGFEQLGGNEPFRQGLYSQNPHLRWFEGTQKGYAILDITPDAVTTNHRVVASTETPRSTASTLAEFRLGRGNVPVEQTAGGDASPVPRA